MRAPLAPYRNVNMGTGTYTSVPLEFCLPATYTLALCINGRTGTALYRPPLAAPRKTGTATHQEVPLSTVRYCCSRVAVHRTELYRIWPRPAIRSEISGEWYGPVLRSTGQRSSVSVSPPVRAPCRPARCSSVPVSPHRRAPYRTLRTMPACGDPKRNRTGIVRTRTAQYLTARHGTGVPT
jgi:hypothetical protein